MEKFFSNLISPFRSTIKKKIRFKKEIFTNTLKINLTQSCNQEHLSCYSKCPEENNNTFIKKEKLLKTMKEFSFWGLKRISFSGGEPLLHPDFFFIYNQAQILFEEVRVSTNGTIPLQGELVARQSDVFIFNFKFSKDENFIRNLHLLNNKTNPKILFNILIEKDTNIPLYKEQILLLKNINLKRILFSLSFDSKKNINQEKEILNEKTFEIVNFIYNNRQNCILHQRVPYCFLLPKLKELLKIKTPQGYSLECLGMLDHNFNIYPCPQHHQEKNPKNMFSKNDIISLGGYEKEIKRFYDLKNKETENLKCQSCEYYKKGICNTGCFPYFKP
jgi:MoaA/NifB/PqqE/SkfB family radical SAM enzyme